MGLRFNRIGIVPGIRLKLGKRGVSLDAASGNADAGVQALGAGRQLSALGPNSRHATFGLPTFVRYSTRELLRLKHISRQSCSVHGAFKNKVWPFMEERVTPLKELR